MKVSAMDVAYRATCQQAEYAGSVSPQWVNGFLLLWPPSTRKKRTRPLFEKFHTYTTGPVIPATRLLFRQGKVTRKQARLMKRAIPETGDLDNAALENIYQRVFENLKLLSGSLVMRRLQEDGST